MPAWLFAKKSTFDANIFRNTITLIAQRKNGQHLNGVICRTEVKSVFLCKKSSVIVG